MTDEEIMEFIKARIKTPVLNWEPCDLFLCVTFKRQGRYIFDKHPTHKDEMTMYKRRFTAEEQKIYLENRCRDILSFWAKEEAKNA